MLNVLWCKINTENRVAGHFDYLLGELAKICNLTIYTKNLHCSPWLYQKDVISGKIVESPVIDNPNQYDCIVVSQAFAFNEDWDNIDVPIFMLFEDQHNDARYQLKKAIKHGWNILHRYQLKHFNDDINGMVKKSIWFPHSVNIDIFKDYGLEKNYTLLQTGAVHNTYRVRNLVNDYFNNHYYNGYKRIIRPSEDSVNKWPIGVDYAKEINKSWFTLVCGGGLEYPVMKYFEIPSCSSIIYSEYFNELKDLGFVPGKNMIEIDFNDIIGQLNYLLTNKNNLLDIISNGHELILNNYTTILQAKKLIKILSP